VKFNYKLCEAAKQLDSGLFGFMSTNKKAEATLSCRFDCLSSSLPFSPSLSM